MHDYLRAIGFSSIQTKTEFENILKDIEQNSQMDFITDDGVKPVLGEKSIDFGENIGINVRGEYDEQGEFCRDYYFPYYRSNDVTMNESVSVEKHSDRFSFVGITDHPNIGVSLIFHLLNMVDYVDHMQQMNKDEAMRDICLSALSVSGKILLPLMKSDEDVQKEKIYLKDRTSKISAARNGDQDAIDSLTLEDLDQFAMAVKRARKEDVLSIVETYFMPYGIACDQYSILGTILDVNTTVNKYTGEQLYLLKVECNSLVFDICINSADLYGEPAVGRRFRGNIWMQGSVVYRNTL